MDIKDVVSFMLTDIITFKIIPIFPATDTLHLSEDHVRLTEDIISSIDVITNESKRIREKNLRLTTSSQFTFCPYHHSGRDGYTSTAVCIGHDVAETDAQERDGDEPHGVEEICMFLIVEPVVAKRQTHITLMMKRAQR